MAGTIADIDGRLIRFSQGSSFEYGDRLHMRRITSLTPTAYQEEDETTFYPAEGHIACHHFSRWNDVAVVDCCRRQPRWGLRSPSAKPHANPEIDLAIRAGTPPEPVK
jgi:hypothetical protein